MYTMTQFYNFAKQEMESARAEKSKYILACANDWDELITMHGNIEQFKYMYSLARSMARRYKYYEQGAYIQIINIEAGTMVADWRV